MNAAPARTGKIEDAPTPSEFEGEIREFTIWPSALSEKTILSLKDAAKLE